MLTFHPFYPCCKLREQETKNEKKTGVAGKPDDAGEVIEKTFFPNSDVLRILRNLKPFFSANTRLGPI